MIGSILVIGDQNKQGVELRNALKKETNFAVKIVPLNAIAVNSVLESEPDLIIMNPKSNYSEILDIYYAIRKEPSIQDTTIAILLDEVEMNSADLPSGIQEIIFRPIRPVEALARIKLLFKRVHKVDQKNLIKRGKLSIDISKYEVRLDDKKIDLTFTEFELLKFLCGSPGTVFTREVLLNKVWGYEYYGGTRTVDVHVRRLRSKIEGKSSVFIETVRNIGYKFVAEED